MNKNVFLIIFLIFLVIFSFSFGCVEYDEISEENFVYLGRWKSIDEQYLVIRANGSGSYEGYSNGLTVNINGGRVVIEDDSIKISMFGLEKNFNIDKKPFVEDGKNKMVLNNIEFYKLE